jgi:hypothetical protein
VPGNAWLCELTSHAGGKVLSPQDLTVPGVFECHLVTVPDWIAFGLDVAGDVIKTLKWLGKLPP